MSSVIRAKDFFALLKRENIGPFVGVPCSLINSLIAYAADHPEDVRFLNPAHESHAMAIAAGEYMGSKGKEMPLVFMQNSGFGNITNPLTSLHQIYDIPAILLVTWRAEEGYGTDAPEHWIVGRDMEQYFQTFGLPYRIVSHDSFEDDLLAMKKEALVMKKPTVLCMKKGLFEKYERKEQPGMQYPMKSAEVIKIIKDHYNNAAFLSTTGMLSRESFTVQDTPDFYMMGSMGLISGIASGAASHTEKPVIILDGDGAIMMHMGLMPYIGSRGQKNMVHIIIDNEAYSSTGGQPTVSSDIDFAAIAKACGYPVTLTAKTKDELEKNLSSLTGKNGPALLHLKVQSGADHHIGRVSDKYTCPQVVERFMENFES
jgi:phosphonopyruvate decarboxylase